MKVVALLVLLAAQASASDLQITRLWGGFRPIDGTGYDIPWRFSDFNAPGHPSETGGHSPVTTDVIYVHAISTQVQPNISGCQGRLAVFRVLPNNNGQATYQGLPPDLREIGQFQMFPRPMRVVRPADDSPAFITTVSGVGPYGANCTGAVHIYWTDTP